MGITYSCPVKKNSCLDPGEGYVVPSLCVGAEEGTSEALVGQFCTGEGFGGLEPDVNGYYVYPENSNKGVVSGTGNCDALVGNAVSDVFTLVGLPIVRLGVLLGEYLRSDSGAYSLCQASGSAGCVSGGHCATEFGRTGACVKQANYADPLICCMRDYQCNDGTDPFGKTCFSQDDTQLTCPPEFRGMDTPYCKFLTTQYCLGNFSNSKNAEANVTNLNPGQDFTALWTDSGFSMRTLPLGTKYQIARQIDGSGGDTPCTSLNKQDGTPQIGTNCPVSGQIKIPNDTSSTYTTNTGDQPICQNIFWRTLFGNEPTFKNQFWNTYNGPKDCPLGTGLGPADNICQQTSIPPQEASCGATPFGSDPTTTGQDYARQILTAAVRKLKAQGTFITESIAQGADEDFILNFLFPTCARYPGLCQEFLREECSSVDPEEFQTNQSKWNWCGCYMSDDKYQKYKNSYGVEKQCTPYCNAANVIPLTNGDNSSAILRCTQNICLIDNVAITLAKTRFQNNTNNLNFSQLCNGCGSGYNGAVVNQGNINTSGNTNLNNTVTTNCQCVLGNFTLNTLGTNITGDGVNLSQSCNGNAKCYNNTTNSDGSETSQEIDCGNNGTNVNTAVQEQKQLLQQKATDTANYWAIFLGVVILILIVILWLVFSPRNLPENDIIFKKPYEVPIEAKFDKIQRNMGTSLNQIQSSLNELNKFKQNTQSQNTLLVPKF